MTIKRVILLLSLTFTCLLSAKAQSHRYFSSDHELSSSLINQLFQDSYGMIWIATEDGLNRYDGSKFTVYHNIPGDSTSLCHNFVNLIFEHSNRELFISTYAGLQIYDRGADRFSKKLPVVTREGVEKIQPVSRILERKNGDVLFLNDDIYKFEEIKDGKAIISRLKYDNELKATPYRIIEDNDSNLWVLGRDAENNYIYRIDTKGHTTVMKNHPAKRFLETIVMGNDGKIYTGSMRTGLYRYEPATDTFTRFTTADGSDLSIKNLINDPASGLILIATDGQGLKTFNPRTEQIKEFFRGQLDFNLPGEKVHHVLKDNFDNFWLGIFQKGVVMFPERQSTFGYIGNRSAIHNVIGDKCVTALCKDDRGVLWVGTDKGGIYALNPDLTLRNHYEKGLPTVIMGMMDDKDHLLIGSYLEGWGLLDKNTGNVEYIETGDTRKSLSIYGFSGDDDGNVWIASMGSGVFTYNPKEKKAVKNETISSHINLWVGSILYSANKRRLYLGTYDGLFAADNCNDSNSVKVSSIKRGTIVYCIQEEPTGKIWCGTSTGLLGYDPESGETVNYTTADGLPSNTVYAIQRESMNALWLSTSSGLSRFDITGRKFSNYHADDGLQSNEFYKNVSYKDNRGIMYFGGMNGITFFSPNDIKNSGIKYTTRIVDFYLHGNPVKVGSKSGFRDIIDRPIYEAERINLSHYDNSFSIEFSTYELNRPESVVFMYSLDDDDWETLPYNVNRVNFSNINPGMHTLRVKAVDNDVESDVLSIKIDIAPVWYNSLLARFVYILLIALIAWYFLNQYKKRQLHRKEIMERENSDRMKEARLQFFTNISHEIRTPMTLVISPIEKLINNDPDPSRQKEYRLIHRNAKRILRLVNEIMDIRKIDKSQMHLTFTEANLVPMIEDLCATFSQVTSDHNITLSFNHGENDEISAWVDAANFDKIIMNLLSNAVKFTPDGGKIDIDLKTGVNPDDDSPLGEYVEISVTDTGIGIPEEDRLHIFERFYQVDTSNIKGTGIGLHLVNSLVQLHYGTIEVSDNPDGQGSRFVIRLPQGNSHLKVSDIALEPVAAETVYEAVTPDLPEEPAEENNPKSVSNERILIVEDDEEIRHYIKKELSSRYKVEECSNGKEALDLIFKKSPSLIISDVMMPEIDGLALTRKIKKNINLQHIPVILLTAKSQDKDNIEGLQSGADAYITKPFNIDVLISTVNNLLLSHKRLRNIYSGNQSHDAKVNINVSSTDEKLMERIMKVLDKNISNPDITVEMLAEEVGMSRVHLHRRLKELTNQSPRDFIRNTRLRQAAKLMSEKRLSVSEAAALTGFKNANNFATSFKALFGMTPTEYVNSKADRGGETL